MHGALLSTLTALPVAYLIIAIVFSAVVGANVGPLFFDEQGYPRHVAGASVKQIVFLSVTWLISSALDAWLSMPSNVASPFQARANAGRIVTGIIVLSISNAVMPLSVLVAFRTVIGGTD